ncbi:NADP-dependent oxidoreductase domain-containing protein 1-like isoform X2 [Xenia sp. Carnegie-2017]|uniref:NADP-dependent oxidoreductase domain-containing protein 1-like isoform X2 n=1 Tax=Xenia sp. Carnegie-2017 TaxID=2897299 RepID=UPI001F03C484|nr:NADP-dependent oxidoreductase domain-containing protein 1-like isoform X2 [Xenia sp. Carnegie-2017]
MIHCDNEFRRYHSNLPSLSFDSVFEDDERSGNTPLPHDVCNSCLCLLNIAFLRRHYFQLRQRNLASLCSACSQAVYFVSILKQVNKAIADKPTNEYMVTRDGKNDLKIGIVGFGRLGKQLAVILLDLGVIKPSDLYISTRCPEGLEKFQNEGICCCFDNALVCKTADVLFLCCLPSQLNTVAKDMQGLLSDTIVYSFVSGVSQARIRQLLKCGNVIQTTLLFKSNCDPIFEESTPWKFGRDVRESLADPKCIVETSPLCQKSLLEMDYQLIESYVHALMNKCIRKDVKEKEKSISICMSVLLGESSSTSEFKDILLDIMKKKTDIKEPPNVTRVQTSSHHDSIRDRIMENEAFRNAFTEQYVKVVQLCFQKISITC